MKDFGFGIHMSPFHFFTFMHDKKLWFVQLCRFLDKMVVRKEDWEAKSSEGPYDNVSKGSTMVY